MAEWVHLPAARRLAVRAAGMGRCLVAARESAGTASDGGGGARHRAGDSGRVSVAHDSARVLARRCRFGHVRAAKYRLVPCAFAARVV